MPTFNDGTIVTGGDIVTLAQARLYNPTLVNLSDAAAQAYIDAASSYLLSHPGLTISELTPPYPEAVQLAASNLSAFISASGGISGVYQSESLGDYSYSLGNGTMLSSMTVPQLIVGLLSPWIKRNSPAKVTRMLTAQSDRTYEELS